MTGTPIDQVVVVVPAHDEEELLGRCLVSVARSRDELREVRPDLVVHVVVVLDRCRDASRAVAADHDVAVVEVDAGSVGVARAAGVSHGRRLAGPVPPAATWVANTDADSVVPEDWLTSQVAAAEAGADLVVGRVRPDPGDLTPDLAAAWERRHRSRVVGQHVHGANLGVRLRAYQDCGGFAAVTHDEDVRLVDALLLRGVTAVPGVVVSTSGRHVGRAPGGFAGYLGDLRAELA